MTFLGLSTLTAEAAPRKSRKHTQVTEADQRKADYIYLEAKRHSLQGRHDAYFELMDYARRLNPDDRAIGMDLGIYYMQLDSAGPERGLQMMSDYVDANPDDLYNGFSYATLSQRLGYTDRATEIWRRLHHRFPDREALTLKYADALRASDDPEVMLGAIELYDSLETAGLDPVDITGYRVGVYYELDDTSAIKGELQKLIERNPSSSNYQLFAGNVYQALLKNDSAIVYYNRAIELDPANGAAYYTRAKYFNERHDSVAYDREVFEALEQPDLVIEVKLALLRDYVASLYTDTLQQPRITELFDNLVLQHPHQVELRNLYADYLMAIRQWTPAAEQVSYALDLEPSDRKRWTILASLRLEDKDFERAVDAAARGLHYFPDDLDLYQIKAIGYTGQKNYTMAEATFLQAIASVNVPDSVKVFPEAGPETITGGLTDSEQLSDLFTGLGEIYYQSGQLDKAFKAYDRALKFNPDNMLALNNIAYNMACEGIDLDRALRMADKVVNAMPDNATSLDTYAWVLFKLKKYAEARKIIDHALECDDTPSADIFEHAGDIYFMDGAPEEAIDFWRKALELKPGDDLLTRKVTHKTYFYK